MPLEILLKGKVISGSGRGKYFLNLPWVRKQINAKLGFDPYIGTLNLRVLNKREITILNKAKGIRIKPEVGYYEGKCFNALVMGKVEGAIVLPNVPDYPSDLIEIISPINLRENFVIKDGMTIDVKIMVN